MQPYIAGIYIYPIKSLDRVTVTKAKIIPGGGLQHDREWAMFDEDGKFVNGKNNPQVHLLRSRFDDGWQNLSLQIQGSNDWIPFNLNEQRQALEDWLSNYFEQKVTVAQNSETGFPDDTDASGPTVISTGTIAEVASWYPGVNIEEMRLRLRANLEIDGVPPFWEDRLFAESGECVRFRVGEVLMEGINPCQRCVVPTRDTKTGKATPKFTKKFVSKRQETLPPWTNRERFDHFFRLMINSNVPASEVGKTINQGDEVEIIGVKASQLA